MCLVGEIDTFTSDSTVVRLRSKSAGMIDVTDNDQVMAMIEVTDNDQVMVTKQLADLEREAPRVEDEIQNLEVSQSKELPVAGYQMSEIPEGEKDDLQFVVNLVIPLITKKKTMKTKDLIVLLDLTKRWTIEMTSRPILCKATATTVESMDTTVRIAQRDVITVV